MADTIYAKILISDVGDEKGNLKEQKKKKGYERNEQHFNMKTSCKK